MGQLSSAVGLLLWTSAVLGRWMPPDRAALIIIDVQNCFLPGGTLAVTDGDQVVPIIKRLRSEFRDRWSLVVMTQDWHCSDHVSFASQHAGYNVYSSRNLTYNAQGELCGEAGLSSQYTVQCSTVAHRVQQTLWPDHCIQNTSDAEFSRQLSTDLTDFVVKKGYNCQVDSYSAFYDNGGFDQTELNAKLQAANITSIYVTGLARDYCVYYTALDGIKLGYRTYVVVDATRGVAEQTSIAAVADMQAKGVHLINSYEVEATLSIRLPQGKQELSAFITIDVQNCFIPGGSLAVAEGDQVIGVINSIRDAYSNRFRLFVQSQDWHCADHVSFGSQHHNVSLYSEITLDYDKDGNLCRGSHVSNSYPHAQSCNAVQYQVQQTMWPDHCVINTRGAEFASDLVRKGTDLVVRKGYRCHIDSYSVFFDNGKFAQTELHEELQKRNITTVYIAGLARDFCVYYTALDAKRLGYKTYVVLDGTRGVNPVTSEQAVKDMREKGVYIISSEDIGDILPETPKVNKGPVDSSLGLINNIFLLYGCLFIATHIEKYIFSIFSL